MSKLFYDHLISIEEVTLQLDSSSMNTDERAELIQLIDEIFHHHVLNVVLNHLPKEHHSEFIDKLTSDPAHPDLITYINSKTNVDIEEEIRKHATRIKGDLSAEIKRAKGHTIRKNSIS